jgi:hypothetical protein
MADENKTASPEAAAALAAALQGKTAPTTNETAPPVQTNGDVQTPQENPNPATSADVVFDESKWVPMGSKSGRLKVPEKPGWHRHWFRTEPGRIERAMQAGYRFVDPAEISMIPQQIGGTPEQGGSTDLGSRVSVAAGGFADNGQALRLYLMECPMHLYQRAKAMLQDDTDNTVQALAAGRGSKDDYAESGNSYIKGNVPKLFQKKR